MSRWEQLRPLDPVRSIKAKFGVIVVASSLLTVGVLGVGTTLLGLRLRWSLLAAFLLSMGVSQVLAHGMTRPLREMTAAARDLAQGRTARPVTTTSEDEVGQLARAFTAMARELATADGQRRQLLANVGHELRTPVAALRAQLENLADGVRPADPAALAEVLAQVERLSELLTDLLDLARADGGRAPLKRGPVGVRALAERTAAQVLAARPGPRIDIAVTPVDLIADADPQRLAQVLVNLLENAAKHGGARGTIHVDARRLAGGGLALEVTDDGPGISPDRWETVFERFRGGTGEIVVSPEAGTGLGLAIARWAVVLHGGTIAVVPAPGPGTRIRVEIPATSPMSTLTQNLHGPPTGSTRRLP